MKIPVSGSLFNYVAGQQSANLLKKTPAHVFVETLAKLLRTFSYRKLLNGYFLIAAYAVLNKSFIQACLGSPD